MPSPFSGLGRTGPLGRPESVGPYQIPPWKGSFTVSVADFDMSVSDAWRDLYPRRQPEEFSTRLHV